MSNLIEDINQCLLALYHGDNENFGISKFRELLFKFDTSEEYKKSEYDNLRFALNDLIRDRNSGYITTGLINREIENYIKDSKHDKIVNNLSNISESKVLKDIFIWSGSVTPDLDTYIYKLKNRCKNSAEVFLKASQQKKKDKSKNEAKDQNFISDKILDEIKDFLQGRLKVNKQYRSPRGFASMIYYFFKHGFFNAEIEEFHLYRDESFCKWFFFDKEFHKLDSIELATRFTNHIKGLRDIFTNVNVKPLENINLEILEFSKRINHKYRTEIRELTKNI